MENRQDYPDDAGWTGPDGSRPHSVDFDRTPVTLPEALYSGVQVRELDRRAIEHHAIPGAALMQRAGEAAFTLLRTRWPRARRLAVLCGPGNNGGDGYVIARMCREAGLDPFVLYLGPPTEQPGDAAAARAACLAAGVPAREFETALLNDSDVIVDALLGIGIERTVTGAWRRAIEAINHAGVPVLAVDIPSGLHADTGAVLGVAVHAHATISFIGLKAGLFTGAGREHAGEIFFDTLDVPAAIYADTQPIARRITRESLHGLLKSRARDAHKGDAGRVLVIGGGRGMPGAARLAGAAAYRAGAGLVTLATHPVHAAYANAPCPELIAVGVKLAKVLRPLLERADVVALGPGLGQEPWSRALFAAALKTRQPLVIDADGLNLLARKPARRADWILTPHPGEAARLLGSTPAKIQHDRFAAARAIATRYGGVCVLKGSGTLIATAIDPVTALCDRGNPGMASGGMGDILTGVIAALRAQGLSSIDAARLGVWLHASAGDAAAQSGEIGLLASDLLPHLRAQIQRLLA
jgi:NAD(P)H-hydrate epimerase